jgi:hypothetical protein
MEDTILGTLREDERDKDVLLGSIAHGGRHIRLRLDPDGGPLPDCLALARSVVPALASIDAKARQAAARDLLKAYNEHWREYIKADGEGGVVDVSSPELTEQQLMSAIVLTNVSILGDSLVTVGYDDAGLFAGHAIVVASEDGVAFSNPFVELFG